MGGGVLSSGAREDGARSGSREGCGVGKVRGDGGSATTACTQLTWQAQSPAQGAVRSSCAGALDAGPDAADCSSAASTEVEAAKSTSNSAERSLGRGVTLTG